MRFSVVIPLYNKGIHVVHALESVLAQTFEDFEILVVDDGSKDDSLQYAKSVDSPKVRVFHQENQGVSVARNVGIENAKGEYIAFLDDDDEYYKNRIRICVDTLSENPEYDAVYTEVDLYHLGEKIGVRNTSGSGLLWKKLLSEAGLSWS